MREEADGKADDNGGMLEGTIGIQSFGVILEWERGSANGPQGRYLPKGVRTLIVTDLRSLICTLLG